MIKCKLNCQCGRHKNGGNNKGISHSLETRQSIQQGMLSKNPNIKLNILIESHACKFCNKKTVSKEFCSQKCQRSSYPIEQTNIWLANPDKFFGVVLRKFMRSWLFIRADNKCEKCGWTAFHPTTGRLVLEIDHINGDWRDNRVDNLQVLCYNCHAMQPTFRALNRRKGDRKQQGQRKKYAPGERGVQDAL